MFQRNLYQNLWSTIRTVKFIQRWLEQGKRTYFFDVKATKSNDLYLTLTESKKTVIDGRESYQKHKIFLYKEDFEKFQDGLADALERIEAINNGEEIHTENDRTETNDESSVDQYSEVSFDDL